MAQLVCLQELLLVTSGHELVLGAALASWMLWSGAGSWIAGRLRRPDALCLAAMPLVLVGIAGTRLAKPLIGLGLVPGVLATLALAVICLAPAAMVSGALFSLGVRFGPWKAYPVAHGFSWEAFGTSAAGVTVSVWLAGRLSADHLLVCFGTGLLGWCILLAPAAWPRTLASVAASLAIWLGGAANVTRAMEWQGYTLKAERPSRSGHLALAQAGDLWVLFDNGLVSAHFPDSAAYERLAHWPLLVHPAPQRVLIIGHSAPGLLGEVLKHPVRSVDEVQPEGETLRAFMDIAMSPAARAAQQDSRVRFHTDDPRRWAMRHSGGHDAVLLAAPAPVNASVNRLYTVEAVRAWRRQLAPGGLLALSVPSSENYLSDQTAEFVAAVVGAVARTFRHTELIPGDPVIVLASDQPLTLDPHTLRARHAARGLSGLREVIPDAFPVLLNPQRRAWLAERLASRAPALNTDFHPTCYRLALRVWLSKHLSPVQFLGMLALAAAVVAALTWVWRIRGRIRAHPGSALLAAMGAASMMTETPLLLAYQALAGAVYWHLGMLIASFMAGLALGSRLAHRTASSTAQSGRWLRGLAVSNAALCLAFSAALSFASRAAVPLPWLPIAGLLLAVAGLLPGAAFPFAMRLAAEGPPAAGRLYAADLWGAALGALLATVLVPLLGLAAAQAAAALVLLAAVALAR